MSHRVMRAIGAGAVGAVFLLALYVVHRELRDVHLSAIRASLHALPTWRIVAAGALTLLSYVLLTGYDVLGLRYAGQPLSYRRTALASFVSYVFSHNLGSVGGVAFRYRLYSAFDLSAVQVAKVAVFCGVTYWLGLLSVGGAALLVVPPTELAALPPPVARLLGGAALAVVAAYLALCARGHTVRVRGWELPVPPLRTAGLQLALSACDWLVSSLLLHTLVSGVLDVSYARFLGVYVAAQTLGVVSHVPGGLGIVESVFLLAFSDDAPPARLLAALLAFRAIYYLLPLALAALLLAVFEAASAAGAFASLTRPMRRWLPVVLPRVFAVVVFGAGVMLLASGATPSVHARREWLEGFLPLSTLEASHLLGSVTGVILLLLARGLQKRLDGAFVMTLAMLVLGAVFSLLKGADWEEASILLVAAALLAPCRAYFYRKASLLDARFSPGWLTAIALSLAASVWLAVFAHKHVEYSNELWWTFAFKGDAPRSLRATFVAVLVGFVLGLLHLLRPARPRVAKVEGPVPPDALAIVRHADKAYANLALLNDKALLLNDKRNAFIMYGTAGRSFVAMGDPVGPEEERKELIWRFRDLCDRYDGLPAFYQVDPENLRYYVEAGLSLLKIGEEALVALADFDVRGNFGKPFRNVVNRLEKDGYTFAIVPESEVDAILPELERVSDEWVRRQSVREKRFSLGFFSDDYLRRCSVAVVRHGEDIVAFANLWKTESKRELSVDLMRYSSEAPPGTMDYLFVKLMLWGKEAGYQTFNLGMAPFAGMEAGRLAPFWSRFGAALYRYGEHFYNFQGLREYKEKFHPRWVPKYLASPDGLALPVVLANVATLISGGMKGVVSR